MSGSDRVAVHAYSKCLCLCEVSCALHSFGANFPLHKFRTQLWQYTNSRISHCDLPDQNSCIPFNHSARDFVIICNHWWLIATLVCAFMYEGGHSATKPSSCQPTQGLGVIKFLFSSLVSVVMKAGLVQRVSYPNISIPMKMIIILRLKQSF